MRWLIRGRPGAVRRPVYWRLLVPIILLGAGWMFATSAGSAQGHDLRRDRLTELSDLIAAIDERNSAEEQRVGELRSEVEALTRVVQGDHEVSRARDVAEELEGPAGALPVSGEAVTVTLDDAPPEARERQVPGLPPPEPDDLVVHQQDVQAVVNALWAGGAEAMQIMDQRVISTSAVRCVGNTLILQGRVYSPPYVITAIGDASRLRAALDDAPGVRIYREYVDAYGLGYKVQERQKVEVPGYSGNVEMRHTRVPAS